MLPSMSGQTLVRAAAFMLMLQAGPAVAGEAPRDDGGATSVMSGPARTGKERLGGKASDEQRVDNCKVPPDRRGTPPRPDSCAEDVSTGSMR